jgi:uncharacterized Zn-finger protein
MKSKVRRPTLEDLKFAKLLDANKAVHGFIECPYCKTLFRVISNGDETDVECPVCSRAFRVCRSQKEIIYYWSEPI